MTSALPADSIISDNELDGPAAFAFSKACYHVPVYQATTDRICLSQSAALAPC